MVWKYNGLDKALLQPFKGCHNRVRDGKCPSIYWPRDRDGYIAFCKEIGPKPDSIRKWSIGRKDHNKGYEPDNIQWEEHRFNSIKRRGTKWEGRTETELPLDEVKFRKGTPEHLEHQRTASLSRWSKLGEREAMSRRMKGNNHAHR